MSCLQHCRGSRLSLHAARAAKPENSPGAGLPSTLSGTWDFKWPVGTEIRIAIQQLPKDLLNIDYARGSALVKEKCDAWLGGKVKPLIPKPNLSARFVGELPAPIDMIGDKRSAKSSAGNGAVVEYHVLVSFLPLPVCIPKNEQHPDADTLVGTSASELGRYALRSEYGVPTLYLGPQFGFAHDEWFESPEGIFTIVHELGHVFGMPHEQQNPRALELPWKAPEDMETIVRGRKGLSPEIDVPTFIAEEIKGRWPGEERFSDWRPPPQAPGYDFDSVMAKPSYRCLLENVHGAECTPEKCPTYDDDLIALSVPTESDLRHMLTMYGERPVMPAVVEEPDSSRAAAQ